MKNQLDNTLKYGKLKKKGNVRVVKTALITGASRGIGRALSNYFAKQGYSLILIAKHQTHLDTLEQELKRDFPETCVETHSVDFTQPETVEVKLDKILEEQDSIEVLVNSAGVLMAGHVELTTQHLFELINVNLLSTMLVCNKVCQKMQQQGYGEIFNLGSTAGLVPVAKIAAYSATKSALVSYSQSLYSEMLEHNITVCCLCPSVVNTDMTNDGRIDNTLKIDTDDLVKAVDFARSLSPGAAMSVFPIRCKVMDKLK